MAKVDRKTLLSVLHSRFDWYSAPVVLDEALESTGLSGRDEFGPAELAALSARFANLRSRMEYVAYEVARLGGGAPAAAAPVAAPAPAAAAPAPAAPAPAPSAPAPKAPSPAGKPAGLAPVDVAAGGAAEATAPAGAQVRITAAEAGVVRWGVNGWKTPAAQPAGTKPVAGEPVVDTPLAPTGAQPPFALVLGPLGGELKTLEFTVRFDGDRWAPPCTVRAG